MLTEFELQVDVAPGGRPSSFWGGMKMTCKCGGDMEVLMVEAVAILQCTSCGRGELIPQAKPHEVFDYRARVTLATKEDIEKDP
jgi:hypothetical protein